ncbi:hypothetical protein pb186bvf_004924 [Paramecium bursaria]
MSDNPMLDSQIYEKDKIINQLKQRIEQLEMEKKIWQDNIISHAQSATNDYLKQTQSVIEQIQINQKSQMDDYYSRIDDDVELQIELKKKEDDFCPQCKELFNSINRSIHNSFEQKKQSLDAKINLMKLRDQEIIKQRSLNQQAVELIQSKDQEIKSMEIKIKSKDIEINQHLTNLHACKKYIISKEKQ